jgi:hypothetical protein
MKKLTFKLIALITVFNVISTVDTFAQVKKGNWLVEGNIGNFSFYKSKNQSESGGSITSKSESLGTSFGVYPKGAYFVINNLAVGSTLGLSFSYYNNKYFNPAGIKTSDYNSFYGYIDIIPFLRYYFPNKKSEKLRFYGQVGGGISIQYFSKYEGTSYNSTGDITSTYQQKYTKPYIYATAEILIGLNYFISKQIAINSSLGYQYNNSSSTYNSTSTTPLGVSTTSPDYKSSYQNHRFNWMLGFTYIIPGKKNKETNSTAE